MKSRKTAIPRDASLLPERRDGDFFVCDILDAAPKGDMASMAHPVFSLSTKPDHRPRRYEDESGKAYLEIRPSSEGLATIHDRDVLIYCISQIMAALTRGHKVSRVVRLKAALVRLQGTQIETNIVTGGTEQLDILSIIDRARILRETRDGRMHEIELSEWVFNAINAHEVLTLHRNYFRLRKPLERRIYEIARKHCGRQREWRVSLAALQRKCGSSSSSREFKRLVTAIVQQDEDHGHMPDYALRLEDDMMVFLNRGTLEPSPDPESAEIRLDPETYAAARGATPGWDVRHLEQAWRAWMADGGLDAPRDPDKVFLGFCRKWTERRGRP